MTDRLPPRAVFCYSQHYAVHAGVHLEDEHCTDAMDAPKLLGEKPHVHVFMAEFPDEFVKPGQMLRCGCGETTRYKP